MSKDKSKQHAEATDSVVEDLDRQATASNANLEALQAELEDARDRALRAQAELDNFRKRARRELEEERQYAALGLMRELLPVMDNIGRALEAAEKTGEGLVEGVRMISQQLQDVLKKNNCLPIESLGQPFDPNWHEAIQMQPTADHEPGTVVAVAQEGYRLADRVVRPSQVVVASTPQA